MDLLILDIVLWWIFYLHLTFSLGKPGHPASVSQPVLGTARGFEVISWGNVAWFGVNKVLSQSRGVSLSRDLVFGILTINRLKAWDIKRLQAIKGLLYYPMIHQSHDLQVLPCLSSSIRLCLRLLPSQIPSTHTSFQGRDIGFSAGTRYLLWKAQESWGDLMAGCSETQV